MNDDMFVQDGILVDTKFSLGPKAFNSAVGYSSFHSVNASDLQKLFSPKLKILMKFIFTSFG